MASRSPTHAFDPTPALEHDPDNYSPLTHPEKTNPDHVGAFKGVRFSETPSMPPHGRHSIATTNVPLLPAVSSASQIPRHGFQATNPTPQVDITAFMDQCRLWNSQLREAHESERKAWDIERTALKARIAELERKLNKSKDPKRRSSNDSSSMSMNAFRSDIRSFGVDTTNRARFSSEPFTAAPPVWIGPENGPPATRVFSHDDGSSHLPSISENDALPRLSREISPTSGGPEAVENVPVPVEQVDKTLDGITLKSSGLASSFDTGITSPQFVSPIHSPSVRMKNPPDDLLHVDVKSLLSPLDEKLKRHAGHTPMAFDGTLSSTAGSSNPLTPKQEQPFAPAPTTRPPLRPSENSQSYFSFTSAADNPAEAEDPVPEVQDGQQEAVHEPEDDPALQGPLILDPDARSPSANIFLEKLDEKLEEVAHRSRRGSSLSDESGEKKPAGPSENAPQAEADEDVPELKIKNSTNFGSAWGGDKPGCV